MVTQPTSSVPGCEGTQLVSPSPVTASCVSVSLSVCFYFHQSLSVSAPLPCASPICAQKPPSLSAPAPAHRSYFGDLGCSRKPDSSKESFLRPPARTTRSTRPAPRWNSRIGNPSVEPQETSRGATAPPEACRRTYTLPSACVTCHHGNGRASSPQALRQLFADVRRRHTHTLGRDERATGERAGEVPDPVCRGSPRVLTEGPLVICTGR